MRRENQNHYKSAAFSTFCPFHFPVIWIQGNPSPQPPLPPPPKDHTRKSYEAWEKDPELRAIVRADMTDQSLARWI